MRLTHNFWLKLLALFTALIFWYVVAPHKTRDVGEENVVIPVKVINVPSKLIIMGDLPRKIEVRLRGEKESLDAFIKASHVFTLDLSNAKAGTTMTPVLASQIQIPSSLEIISITPVNIDLHLESRLQKMLPIAASIQSHPPKQMVWDVTLIPEKALVVGPESVVEHLNAVATLPITPDLKALPFRDTVLLTPPHPLVQIIQPPQALVIVKTKAVKRRRSRRRR